VTFSAVAIIAAHNEADIIDQVIRGLVDQGIDVYFLDDGSTDGTVAAVERHLRRGVRCIEHLSDTFRARPAKGFEWERILRRKVQLASELDATWFVHHDADEFRESPWPGLTLREAIQRVDAHGFNAIDFELFNFWPVQDGFRPGDDVRESLQFYSPAEPYDRARVVQGLTGALWTSVRAHWPAGVRPPEHPPSNSVILCGSSLPGSGDVRRGTRCRAWR